MRRDLKGRTWYCDSPFKPCDKSLNLLMFLNSSSDLENRLGRFANLSLTENGVIGTCATRCGLGVVQYSHRALYAKRPNSLRR